MDLLPWTLVCGFLLECDCDKYIQAPPLAKKTASLSKKETLSYRIDRFWVVEAVFNRDYLDNRGWKSRSHHPFITA